MDEIFEPLSKSKMLDIIELNLTNHPVTTMSLPAQRRLRASILNLRTGLQSISPAICPGPVKCPFRCKCPLVNPDLRDSEGQIDYHHQAALDFPLGKSCVVESAILALKRRDYIEEYDVSPDSPTDMSMVNKMAELDLLEMRISLILAGGDDRGEGVDLLKKQVTGFSELGQEITRLEVHPAWDLKERIQKQRDNILQAMVGTRRERYKRDAALKQKQGIDPSSTVSALREKIEKMRTEVGDDIIDAEFREEPAKK